MRKIVMAFAMLFCMGVNAQVKQGITFVSSQQWDQVLQMAKTQNKLVFVDVYATWCVPCKQMDNEVYSDGQVGAYTDSNFVSLKVQMDSTVRDDSHVKAWRAQSGIFKRFTQAYPTLLFFNADGKLVDKQTGFQNKEKFLQNLHTVLSPDEGYVGQLRQFIEGKLDAGKLLKLSYRAKENGDDSIGLAIAKRYKELYIDSQPAAQALNKSLLGFLNYYSGIFRLEDQLIRYIYENPKQADSLFDMKDFSVNYINYMVRRDFFGEAYEKDGKVNPKVDWKRIENKIAKKLDHAAAKRAVLAEKIAYFAKKGDWNNQAKYEFQQVEFRGIDYNDNLSLAKVNDMIFTVIFNHPVSREMQETGLRYMKKLIAARPRNYHYIDTYAGLLYKVGAQKAAIAQSELALKLAEQEKDYNLKYYIMTLSKMKNNEPTWDQRN